MKNKFLDKAVGGNDRKEGYLYTALVLMAAGLLLIGFVDTKECFDIACVFVLKIILLFTAIGSVLTSIILFIIYVVFRIRSTVKKNR
ncbi:MAG: hypothetical protein WCO30_00140 [bacterium]